MKKIIDELSSGASSENLIFYEFGNSVREVGVESLKEINLSDGATNIQEVFNSVKNSDKNIASVTLITDGVITSGANPYYDAVNVWCSNFYYRYWRHDETKRCYSKKSTAQ